MLCRGQQLIESDIVETKGSPDEEVTSLWLALIALLSTQGLNFERRTGGDQELHGWHWDYSISGRAMHAGLVCSRLEKKELVSSHSRPCPSVRLANIRDGKVILDSRFLPSTVTIVSWLDTRLTCRLVGCLGSMGRKGGSRGYERVVGREFASLGVVE